MVSRESRLLFFGRATSIVLLTAMLASASATPASALFVSVTGSQTGTTVNPGGDLRKVFQVQITSDFPAVLTSLSFTNATIGPGSQAQKDQDWQTLELRDSRIQQIPIDPDAGILDAQTGGPV